MGTAGLSFVSHGMGRCAFTRRRYGRVSYQAAGVSHPGGGWFEGIPGVALDDWSPGETTDGQKSDTENGQNGPPEISPDTYRELQRRARENGDEYVKHDDAWVRVDPEQGARLDQTLEKYEKQADGSFKIPAGSILEI